MLAGHYEQSYSLFYLQILAPMRNPVFCYYAQSHAYSLLLLTRRPEGR